MPAIELRVRDVGEPLNAMMALHHKEIEVYVHEGVERAAATLGEQVIAEAARITTERVHAEVQHYLKYGLAGRPCCHPPEGVHRHVYGDGWP